MTLARARWLFAVALTAGCVDLADDGGAWEPIESIAGELAAEVGPVPASVALPDGRLRIATWNVHYGFDTDGLARAIGDSQALAGADVLLVQEIDAHPGEAGTRASRFATALGMTWIYVPARPEQDGTHGLAIVSRFPIENARVRQLPFFDQHFNSRNRIAVGADIVLGQRRVHVVDVHLDVRITAADRVRQLHPAVNDVPDDVVVGGDFNTNPWAWVEGTLPLVGTEAIVGQKQAAVIDDYLGGKGFASAISADVATMRLPAFQMRTDNVHVRGYSILAAGVEHVDGSDHWPVWVDIGL